jgi:hypothetical protein
MKKLARSQNTLPGGNRSTMRPINANSDVPEGGRPEDIDVEGIPF